MLELQTERVLVVPTEIFHRLGHFQGFSADAERYLRELLRPEHTSYRPRADVEHDPGYKQLIPYCIFRHRDAGGRETVFQYTRGKGQGEGRLHAKRSVGVGGHISADDDAASISADTNGLAESAAPFAASNRSALAAAGPYWEGLRRELDEEVAIASPFTQRCVGLINDDQTEVGRVHLGVVHLFELDRPTVSPRERDLLDSGFRPLDELLSDLTGFETWSQICLTALFAI